MTSIGNQAFYNCSGLTEVQIPSSIISKLCDSGRNLAKGSNFFKRIKAHQGKSETADELIRKIKIQGELEEQWWEDVKLALVDRYFEHCPNFELYISYEPEDE